MKPHEAYKLTLREISIFIDGRRAAELFETKRGIDAGYLSAMLAKTDPKKFPDSPAKFYPAPKLTRKQRANQNAARMLALKEARNASFEKKQKATTAADPVAAPRKRKKK